MARSIAQALWNATVASPLLTPCQQQGDRIRSQRADELARANVYTTPRTITLDTRFQGVPQIIAVPLTAAVLWGASENALLQQTLLAAVATVAVFTMIPIWNDLWFPLLLAPTDAPRSWLVTGTGDSLGAAPADPGATAPTRRPVAPMLADDAPRQHVANEIS